MREHVHRHGNQIQITGALTITKECAFYSFRTGHQSKLGCSNTSAAIIMRMQADDRVFSIRQMSRKILNLIRIDVGRCHFNSARQVQNNLVIDSWPPDIHHRRANLNRKIHFSRCIALG